jgi:hypothetical protein
MGSLLDKAFDHLMQNARVAKDAPLVFAAVLALAFVAAFWLSGLRYQGAVDQKQSTIDGLKTQIDGLKDQISNLQQKLAERPVTAPVAPPSRDPDMLYQFGAAAARAPGGVLDRPAGLARFPRVISGPDFNMQSDMEYRQFVLTGCRHGSYYCQTTLGLMVQQFFSDVVCHISGLRP